MARARNIKPGFFKNEELACLPFEARLLFIGLWTLADREGRLEDRPKRIMAELFPYDRVDVDPLLRQLQSEGFLLRYEAGGKCCIQIVNFIKHQQPHHKEIASVLPKPPDDNEHLGLQNNGLETSDQYQSNVEPSMNHEQLKQIASCPTDSLIPDSLICVPTVQVISAAPKRPEIPVREIVDLYHEVLPMCPQVRKLTATRKKQIEARWRCGDLPDMQTWRDYFEFCAESKFLTGLTQPMNGHKHFVADLEWLSREGNYAKIYERKYHR